MTLLSVPFLTSITCSTSPARVPTIPAFSMMNNCSFSVVHSRLHMADSESPVVTELPSITASPDHRHGLDGIHDRVSLHGVFLGVLRPRSWQEMRSIRFRLARCAASEHFVPKLRRTPSGEKTNPRPPPLLSPMNSRQVALRNGLFALLIKQRPLA